MNGKYRLEVYGVLNQRLDTHQCDDVYNDSYRVAMAVSNAITDETVAVVRIICPDRSIRRRDTLEAAKVAVGHPSTDRIPRARPVKKLKPRKVIGGSGEKFAEVTITDQKTLRMISEVENFLPITEEDAIGMVEETADKIQRRQT